MVNTTNSVEVIQIGDGLGIELPPDVLAQLKVAKPGDAISVQLTPQGLEMRALTEVERQLRIAEKIMAERHELLHRLAE